MEQRIFHGNLTPGDFGHALIAEFNRGNYRAQQLGSGDQIAVQIGTRDQARSGGQTALTISLQKVEDGVAIRIGQQAWSGVAASLGQTALLVWRNPFELLNRLDDLAQDFEHLKLSEQAWTVIESAARAMGASFELSERLRRLECLYCGTANATGEPSCIACGAPLGQVQPRTCANCGFVVKTEETKCPNCGKKL